MIQECFSRIQFLQLCHSHKITSSFGIYLPLIRSRQALSAKSVRRSDPDFNSVIVSKFSHSSSSSCSFFCKPPVQSGQTLICSSVISKQARQRKDCARQCKNTRCQRRNILRTRQYPGEACERQHSPCTQGKVFLYGVSSPPFCFSQLFHYFPSDSFAILSISKSIGL